MTTQQQENAIDILVVIELDNEAFSVINWKIMGAVSRLRELSSANVDLLIAGKDCAQAAQVAASIYGVRDVLVSDADAYYRQLAECVTPLVAALAGNYSYVLMGATTFGKSILPGVGALLDVQPVTDVVSIETLTIFKRPVFAGRAFERIADHQPIKLLSIRPSAFTPFVPMDKHEPAPIKKLDSPEAQALSYVVTEAVAKSDRPELTSARVVISGGRGLQSAENFQLLYQLADKLNAAVGASRAAVDAGFAPNDMQVGQTGKTVAPELYIAVGLSGAVQHIAGMRDSAVIVAINNDPGAPIFQVADYGLVMDLFEALPELIAQL